MNIYPTEPGIYWARSDSKTKTYNMIVIIKGKFPFSQVIGIDLSYIHLQAEYLSLGDVYEFGPKIEKPKF